MVQIQFQIMNVNDNAAKENWAEEQKKSNNNTMENMAWQLDSKQ